MQAESYLALACNSLPGLRHSSFTARCQCSVRLQAHEDVFGCMSPSAGTCGVIGSSSGIRICLILHKYAHLYTIILPIYNNTKKCLNAY